MNKYLRKRIITTVRGARVKITYDLIGVLTILRRQMKSQNIRKNFIRKQKIEYVKIIGDLD